MEAVIQQAGLERTALPVKKKRIGSVDICKGIAMIYVIIVHFFPGATGLSTAIGFMLYFYYAISTYFYKPQRTAWENIKRRVKQLLVPMAEYIIGLNILSYLYM